MSPGCQHCGCNQAGNGNQVPTIVTPKKKKKSHPANMYILFFQETYKQYGGNMHFVSRIVGTRWKYMTPAEKNVYKKKYLANLAAQKKANQAQAQTHPKSG